jgi:hypothetical protein
MPAVWVAILSMRGYIDNGREAVAHLTSAPQPSRRIFFDALEMHRWHNFAREYEAAQRENGYGSMTGFYDSWNFKTVDEMRLVYT